mgnify:CR=1 FL=1|tara:strand:+ start:1212 stop:1703 length:492 start_codon:yes stop_codon:yes gene_type:complete
MERTKQLLNNTPKDNLDPQDVFKAICLDASENLDANLTSVWTFDKARTQIECQASFDKSSNTFSQGQILKRDDFPSYFSYITEDNIINATDVRTHYATKELVECYFDPMQVVSLLDFILHKNYQPVGVICCENKHETRKWSTQNEDYLRALSALTSFNFEFEA